VSTPLKLLVDVGVGKAVEDWLQSVGYDIRSVRDLGPRTSDDDILTLAVTEQRLVVTMDKDFGELVYHSGQPHAGVLLLRLESAPSDEKVRVVTEIFTNFAGQMTGRFSVYRAGRLRIR
jgi:predicted nuclease of predicted toxin-antitoxin system